MLSYQPHFCRAVHLAVQFVLAAASAAEARRRPSSRPGSLRGRFTSTASGVSTTTTSCSPTTLTSRLVACTSESRLSEKSTSPVPTLPCASLGATCQTASHAPQVVPARRRGAACAGRCRSRQRARALLHPRSRSTRTGSRRIRPGDARRAASVVRASKARVSPRRCRGGSAAAQRARWTRAKHEHAAVPVIATLRRGSAGRWRRRASRRSARPEGSSPRPAWM